MYLVDTNILIYHFNNTIPQKSHKRLHEIFVHHFNVSVITRMEFLGFKNHTSDSFAKAHSFLEFADIINIDDAIVDTVVGLRRKVHIKLPDAIIAATAIVNELTIVTRNIRDFANSNVQLYNPFET